MLGNWAGKHEDNELYENYVALKNIMDNFYSDELKELFDCIYPQESDSPDTKEIISVCIELEAYEEFLQSFGL